MDSPPIMQRDEMERTQLYARIAELEAALTVLSRGHETWADADTSQHVVDRVTSIALRALEE